LIYYYFLSCCADFSATLISFVPYIGFAWHVLGSGGPRRVASMRSCEKLPPCPLQPVPAGFKTELLLAKAEPISDSGSTCGIT